MSAVIMQMVMRKRAAKAQVAAAMAEREAIIAQAKGDPGLTWRGEWDKDADYMPGDAVASAGSSFIASAPSTGERPKKGSEFWDVLALKGADGKAAKEGRVTVVSGGGGSELNTLSSESVGTPETVAVKINGRWVQMPWAAFIALLPSGGLPAGAVTVDGDVITVNGEYVTVT